MLDTTEIHPALNDQDFERLVELDAKDVEGTLTRKERKEEDALLRKWRWNYFILTLRTLLKVN